MTLGQIIAKYREEHELSMREFAEAAGFSKAYIWQLEHNTNRRGKAVTPTVATIQKAAKAMFMSFDELFAMVGDDVMIDLSESVVAKKAVRIPVLGRVAAGIPISAIEEVLDYEEISEKMAHSGSYFALQIKGDSMEPEIKNGSTVIVRQQDDAKSYDIVIALVNGDDAVCKKLLKSKNGLTLISINSAYEPVFYSDKEIEELPVRIIGKVVECRTKYK